MQAFKEAIQRRVAAHKKLSRGAHVLDLGCGTGFTATAAALAGADSVTACDLHTPMTALTRRVSFCFPSSLPKAQRMLTMAVMTLHEQIEEAWLLLQHAHLLFASCKQHEPDSHTAMHACIVFA